MVLLPTGVVHSSSALLSSEQHFGLHQIIVEQVCCWVPIWSNTKRYWETLKGHMDATNFPC